MKTLELTIPANTLETSPTSITIDVGVSVIKSIRVTIPDGHKFLARMRIHSRGIQIFPAPGSSTIWHRGNNSATVDSAPRSLEGPPFQITAEGWNEDDTYPHTFFVEVQ
jgi:hypothetical protein